MQFATVATNGKFSARAAAEGRGRKGKVSLWIAVGKVWKFTCLWFECNSVSDWLENWQRCHNMKAIRVASAAPALLALHLTLLLQEWVLMAINVTGKWDYAHGAHRHFTDSGKSQREIARESDSRTHSGKPQTTITPKNIRNKMPWSEQWGATIGALLWLTLCPGS